MARTKRPKNQHTVALPEAAGVSTTAADAGIHGNPPHRVPEGKVPAVSHLSPPPAIGPKLKQFRLKENLTLHDLQAMTGISKSMLSQIERGVVNPTFARVWHLTQSLGIGVGDLLGDISPSLDRAQTYEHLKVNKTPVMTSADGLCITRILSPIHQSLPFEWYASSFPDKTAHAISADNVTRVDRALNITVADQDAHAVAGVLDGAGGDATVNDAAEFSQALAQDTLG